MPERIGSYRLESPLGRGGMGEVFLAWDERLERPVAIKRIREDAFLQGHQRERFRREARLAARLSHASIVQVHDLVIEESGDAIVMEYVEGPTLAERLARGPLGTAEAVRLAREIAEGLAAAHEAGLIHRDLKAENVVVTPAGHAKILDFGLARPVSWDGEILTQHGALIGTCYAMSPEQASGGELDERSDLFSFGALLYEMLTGRSAFRAKDPRATLQRVLYGQPQPLTEVRPDLPPALVSLVERLLAKDRDDRPRNALSVVHKLEKIERELPEEEWPERNDDSLSEMPTQAFPALPYRRSATAAPRSLSAAERPLRRARGWILFLSGALAALVIAVAINQFPPTLASENRALHGLQAKIEEGRSLDQTDFAQLEEIIENSSEDLEVLIFASEAYRSRFQYARDINDRARAIRYSEKAQKLSPSDSRPVVSHFKIALEWSLVEAAKDLEQLKKLMKPGDPQLLVCQANLAVRRGQIHEALDYMQEAVKQVRGHSWRNLLTLADLEIRLGYDENARQHLNELLGISPDNQWGMAKLAELELRYGDIAKAELLYLELISEERKRGYFTNLGLARSLLGNYRSAIDAYKEALVMAPDYADVLLNLAEAELALGLEIEAKDHLRRTLKGIEERRQDGPLSVKDSMTQAQCLARLGHVREAVKITQDALRQGSDDSEVLYMAALVYALAGDRQSALVNAQGALDKRLRPEWFQLLIFPLREDPELKDMVQKAVSSRSS